LPQQAVVSAAIEVLDILAVAHEANVVHRDVKPENVLLCDKGTVKLADFGLAGLCHELGMLTGTNQALGTPAYMSPEQARGDTLRIDARTDIWGLGATMFSLLTGRYVHASSAQKNLVVAAATEPAPPILSVEPGLDPALAEVIDRALQLDKEKRWPNARAMLAELRALDVPSSAVRPVRSVVAAEGATMSTTSASHMSWSQAKTWLTRGDRARRSRVRLLIGATIAGLVVLAALQGFTSDRTTTKNAPVETTAGTAVQPARPVAELPRKTSNVSTNAPRETPGSTLAERPMPTTRRPVTAKTRSRQRAEPAAQPSATTPAPPVATASPLSIPDEVLDRRE
jgi:serine/threonine-protein kinase